MKLKSLDIGRLTLRNNIFVSPMAGYTDYAFRALCYKLGAGACVTEMVSAKGLIYKNENTEFLLRRDKEEKVSIAQIFGCDPDIMCMACESEALKPFDIIDINMGCPVNKIYSNGEGSRLMEKPDLAEKIVKSCCNSGKTITVKFRTGIRDNELIAADFGKRMEQAGAKLITVHGRTKEGMYSGKVHYDEIAKLKKSVQIPVIANGGIFTASDADKMIELTGADGVGLARGVIFDPLLISGITGVQTDMTVKDCAFYLMDKRREFMPDKLVAHAMRKTLAGLLKGVRGGKNAKLKIFAAESTDELKQILNEVFEENII